MKTSLTTFALTLALAGCALFPTEEQLRSGDYGPYPNDYQDIVRRYMDGYLKDGDSARFKFLNTPTRFAAGAFTLKYGYAVCVDVNARNGFGAYVGYRRSFLLINRGQVVDTVHSDGTYDSLAADRCEKAFASSGAAP